MFVVRVAAYQCWLKRMVVYVYADAEGVMQFVVVVVDVLFRNMEDFVTWVDTSKVRQHMLKYNDMLDDYDLLN